MARIGGAASSSIAWCWTFWKDGRVCANRSANIACHNLIRHWIQKHEAGQLIDVRIAEYEGQDRRAGAKNGP